MFIIVWGFGWKACFSSGVLLSYQAGCRPKTGPCWRKSALLPSKEEKALPSVVAALYLLDSRLSILQRNGTLSLQFVLLGFSTINLEITQLPTASPRCSVNHRPAPAAFALVGPSLG